MQVVKFDTGGFAIHKVTGGPISHKASAWFDSEGTLLDAEWFDHRNVAYHVRVFPPSPTAQYLGEVGKCIASRLRNGQPV